jgi:hypothetical protein
VRRALAAVPLVVADAAGVRVDPAAGGEGTLTDVVVTGVFTVVVVGMLTVGGGGSFGTVVVGGGGSFGAVVVGGLTGRVGTVTVGAGGTLVTPGTLTVVSSPMPGAEASA